MIRWFVEGQIDLTSNEDLSKVDSLLRAFRGSPLSMDYNRNFELEGRKVDFDTLCRLCYLDIDSTYEGIDELKGHTYKVVRLHSFEEAEPYKKYAPLWCIFQGEEAFRSYTIDGVNKLYLILRDDYKEVPAKPGLNTPRDAYGVSMICVIKNPEDQIVTVTSRWNSDRESDRFLSNDELEELIGEYTMDDLFPTDDKIFSI